MMHVPGSGTRTLGLADATCDKNIRFVGSQTSASNGLLQVIDTVMFPPGTSPAQRTLCCTTTLWCGMEGCSRQGRPPSLATAAQRRLCPGPGCQARCFFQIAPFCARLCQLEGGSRDGMARQTFAPRLFSTERLLCWLVWWRAGVINPDQLFWVEQRGAGRVGFDGWDCRAKGSTLLSVNEYKPVGLAVDSNVQMVFWSNDMNDQPKDSWISMVRRRVGLSTGTCDAGCCRLVLVSPRQCRSCRLTLAVSCVICCILSPQSYFNSTGGVTHVLTNLYDPQGT